MNDRSYNANCIREGSWLQATEIGCGSLMGKREFSKGISRLTNLLGARRARDCSRNSDQGHLSKTGRSVPRSDCWDKHSLQLPHTLESLAPGREGPIGQFELTHLRPSLRMGQKSQDWASLMMDMSLSKLLEIVKVRETWHAVVYGVAKN